MLIYKIIAIGITGTAVSLLVKQYKPEIAIAIPILTVIAILGMCIPYLKLVLEAFEKIVGSAGIQLVHMQAIIKIIGVAYVCQFASDICADAGEKAIAGKIELGGKIVIITLSMPIIYNLLELVNEIMSF